jgi:hypothetical protein
MMMMNNQEVEKSRNDEASEGGSFHDNGMGMPKPDLKFDRTIWLVWWIGTILIVLSWLGVVSVTIGWIGFAGALASTLVSVIARKYWQIPK